MMLKETLGILGFFLIQRTSSDETAPGGTNECLELHPGFKECGITGINGKWTTDFSCGDKDFNAQLEITFAEIDGGDAKGEFNFWTKDGVSGDPINGKHEVKGTIDADSGGVTLLGIKWIVQPPNWSGMFSFLNGNFNSAKQTIHVTLLGVCREDVLFVRQHEPIKCENEGMCITNGSVPEDQMCCCTKGFTGRTCNASSVPETTTQNEAALTTTQETRSETTVTPNSTYVIQETTIGPKKRNMTTRKKHASQETTTTKINASQETKSTHTAHESTFGTTLMQGNMTVTPPKTEPPLTASANTVNQRRYYFATVFIIHMLREIIFIVK